MYKDRFGEFVIGYRDLKGYYMYLRLPLIGKSILIKTFLRLAY